jgi:hypothetical protein
MPRLAFDEKFMMATFSEWWECGHLTVLEECDK